MNINRRISPLELYVRAYLRQKGKGKKNSKFIHKALALVNEKLGVPCCTNPNAIIDLFTDRDNDFTNTVRMMLNAMPKAGNVASLNKVVTILNNVINPACCA